MLNGWKSFRTVLWLIGCVPILAAGMVLFNPLWRVPAFNLFVRAWREFLITEGSSTVGMFSNWASPIIAVAITIFLIRHHRGQIAMERHWKEEAVIAIRAVVMVAVVMYGPVLVWKCIAAVYLDHATLMSRITDAEEKLVKPLPDSPHAKPYVSNVDFMNGYLPFGVTPFKLSVSVKNGSPELTAKDITTKVELRQIQSGEKSEEMEFARFLVRSSKRSASPRDLAPGQEYAVVTNDLTLSPDQWELVRTGRSPTYLFAVITDGRSRDPISETCLYFSGAPEVDQRSRRHDCQHHNR
jgi:hypothetical protein